MAPRAVFMKTSLRPLNTTRPVYTTHPKTTVYSARPMSCFSKSAQSTVNMTYQIKTALTNKNFSQKVNTTKGSFYTSSPKAVNTARPNSAVVNVVRENQVNAVKTSAFWVWRPTKLNSASITLKKHNYVDVGGISKSVMAWVPKGNYFPYFYVHGHLQKEDQGYIDSGCSRHMTNNMSYLSDFKEFDRGYVTFGGGAKEGKFTGKGTLKTGKLDFEDVYFLKELQFNLFSVSQMCDKKNSVLFTNTTCFVLSPDFKLADESQVLLKVPRKNNMYIVDMKNIVPKESLTCLVAKATLDESMLWHRRLGHVNFKNINKLVQDNLVRGLPSKRFKNDKTYVACLKGKQHKASYSLRCDNGTEFKNKVMSEFCEKKGIKREFSIARTPQQNGVAERRNKTLIDVARTMVLVVQPHNKTPYELFRGRTPALSFMRPFWCRVTILNTLDYLGKFDGKLDEGFFVGYSLNSDGPKWLFDIDVLTKSINYVPLVVGTNSNDFVDLEESVGTGHSSKETGSSQDYILMSLWKYGSLFDSSSNNDSNDEPQPSSDVGKKDDKGVSKESGINDQERLENSTQDVNTIGPSINTDSTNVNTGSLNINTASPTVTTAPLEATHADYLTLVDLPYGKRAIRTKWVYRNKKDERVARIEAIRLFLSYDSFKDIVVYQMDVKSAFMYGKIKEEVYVCQPLGFEDPEFPDKVYKRGQIDKTSFIKRVKSDILLVQVYVDDIIFGFTRNEICIEFEKMMHNKFQMSSMGELTFFLGLQVSQKDDGIFISQEKYMDEILKKFGFSTVKTTSTPMETSKPLLKDAKTEDVDGHLYRSMIGSL
ncbi:putative ribonuclease H-like domain-containing protein, partial [Tanacetum coccineum]